MFLRNLSGYNLRSNCKTTLDSTAMTVLTLEDLPVTEVYVFCEHKKTLLVIVIEVALEMSFLQENTTTTTTSACNLVKLLTINHVLSKFESIVIYESVLQIKYANTVADCTVMLNSDGHCLRSQIHYSWELHKIGSQIITFFFSTRSGPK